MEKIVQVINNLPGLLSLKPATEEQIKEAENKLQLVFAKEYKTFLSTFGAILAEGIELSGIAKSEHRNVVNLTQSERSLNSNIPQSMYVVENTCIDGIIIWQDENGYIYQSSPNLMPKKIASSLAEYVLKSTK